MAILMGNSRIASDLIANGCKVYFDKNDAQKDLSPLFMAIEGDKRDLLEQMYDSGADITVRDSKGQSPLLYAILRKKQSCIDYLSW